MWEPFFFFFFLLSLGRGWRVELCRRWRLCFKLLSYWDRKPRGSSLYIFCIFFFFDLFQAGTGFLRPDEFLRQSFAIVIVAHCFLSAFDSLKRKILIGFVSFTFCLPPSQVLKQPFLIVRLEIKLLR